MRAAGQTPQHPRRIGLAGGLAEHLVVEHDFGVGAEHDRPGHPDHLQQTRPGLFARDPADIVLRRLARLPPFDHLDVEHAEIDAELAQQLAAAWGLGGEVEHGGKYEYGKGKFQHGVRAACLAARQRPDV